MQLNTLSLGLIALSAISVATTAMESEAQGAGVSDLKTLFESPQKPVSFVSQVKDDVKSASPISTRSIALHLSEEAKVRATKEVEAEKLVAQTEIEKIKKEVEIIRAEAALEIKKIREDLELEKTKASKELEDLKRQKDELEKELNAAKDDTLLTKSGLGGFVSSLNPVPYVSSLNPVAYFNPWAYYGKEVAPQQISNTEVNPIGQTDVKEGTQ